LYRSDAEDDHGIVRSKDKLEEELMQDDRVNTDGPIRIMVADPEDIFNKESIQCGYTLLNQRGRM
jgi:hypothetical protein